MCDGVCVEGLNSRYEPPSIEESAPVLDPGGGKLSCTSAQVLADGCEECVKVHISGRGGLAGDKAWARLYRSTVEDLDTPKGEPESSGLVALGETLADLEADVGDGRGLMGHLLMVGAGCLDRRAYPSSFLAITTRWIWLVPS